MSTHAYVFDARLADDPGVSRTVAVGGDQTLDDVHHALRQAFEWHGDFPYAFRLDDGRDYAGAPGEGVDVTLAGLGLRSGGRLQHDIEGPEEWRFALTVLDVRPDNEPLPRVLERDGAIVLEPEAELGGED
jgi:pRiA4b ORF-3-like protein